MMKRSMQLAVCSILGLALVVGLTAAAAGAQANAEAEIRKIADAFSQAWAKGDAKAIAALHTKDALRMSGTDESPTVGTAAIEQAMTTALSGPFKGSTLKIDQATLTQVAPNVYVGGGTYAIGGATPPAGTPTSGQYMNTMVNQGGRWLIAASAVMPAMQAK